MCVRFVYVDWWWLSPPFHVLGVAHTTPIHPSIPLFGLPEFSLLLRMKQWQVDSMSWQNYLRGAIKFAPGVFTGEFLDFSPNRTSWQGRNFALGHDLNSKVSLGKDLNRIREAWKLAVTSDPGLSLELFRSGDNGTKVATFFKIFCKEGKTHSASEGNCCTWLCKQRGGRTPLHFQGGGSVRWGSLREERGRGTMMDSFHQAPVVYLCVRLSLLFARQSSSLKDLLACTCPASCGCGCLPKKNNASLEMDGCWVGKSRRPEGYYDGSLVYIFLSAKWVCLNFYGRLPGPRMVVASSRWYNCYCNRILGRI